QRRVQQDPGSGRRVALTARAADHCGGLTPSLLTCTREALSAPSAAVCAPMNTYSPTLRSVRVPGTAFTSAADGGTMIRCSPSLNLSVSSRRPTASTIAPTLALVIVVPGS